MSGAIMSELKQELIVLQITYTLSDAIHAHRRYYSTKRRSKFDKLIAIVIAGTGVYCFASLYPALMMSSASVMLLDVILPIIFVLLGIMLWFDIGSLLGIRAGYKNAEKLEREYEFTFDNSVAAYNSGSDPTRVEVKFAWSEFQGVIESKQAFLLLLKLGDYWAIPKRCFASVWKNSLTYP
jgi:hypothetical protein